MSEWLLPALEFSVGMQAHGRDRLPYPLVCHPPGDTGAEIRRLRREAAHALALRRDERLFEALRVLADPQVRIEVFGFDAPGLATRIRIHAGIQRATAVIASQRPATGDVLIRRGPANSVVDQLLGSLPAAPAGSRRALRVHRDDLVEKPGNYMAPANEITVSATSDQFFRRRRDTLGEIGIFARQGMDRPHEMGRTVSWIDFSGDGRYLVKGRRTITATPIDRPGFAAELRGMVLAATRETTCGPVRNHSEIR